MHPDTFVSDQEAVRVSVPGSEHASLKPGLSFGLFGSFRTFQPEPTGTTHRASLSTRVQKDAKSGCGSSNFKECSSIKSRSCASAVASAHNVGHAAEGLAAPGGDSKHSWTIAACCCVALINALPIWELSGEVGATTRLA